MWAVGSTGYISSVYKGEWGWRNYKGVEINFGMWGSREKGNRTQTYILAILAYSE